MQSGGGRGEVEGRMKAKGNIRSNFPNRFMKNFPAFSQVHFL